MKKLLSILTILSVSIVFALSFYIFATGPKLPDETNAVIEKVTKSSVPNFVTGKQGFAASGSVKIWYEEISPHGSPKGTIVLFMGISNDALGWPEIKL